MKIVLDLTEKQVGLLQSGIATMEDIQRKLGNLDTAEEADKVWSEIESAKHLDISMESLTLEEVFHRAWTSVLNVWRTESERVEKLHADGKSAPIAMWKSEVAWKKQEELHDILLNMEKRRLGDEK